MGQFARAVLVRDVLANRGFISGLLLRMRRKKCTRLLIDLAMPFRKAIAKLTTDLRNLKITASGINDRVAEPTQYTRELVIVHVLSVFLRAEHFVILQRFPTTFPIIVRRVEDDAMRVQVRVERA